MARVKGAMMTRKRRNATLKLAKGYWGSKSPDVAAAQLRRRFFPDQQCPHGRILPKSPFWKPQALASS